MTLTLQGSFVLAYSTLASHSCRPDRDADATRGEAAQEGAAAGGGDDRTREAGEGGRPSDQRGVLASEPVQAAGAGLGQEGQAAAGQRGGAQRYEKDPRADLQPVQDEIGQMKFLWLEILL